MALEDLAKEFGLDPGKLLELAKTLMQEVVKEELPGALKAELTAFDLPGKIKALGVDLDLKIKQEIGQMGGLLAKEIKENLPQRGGGGIGMADLIAMARSGGGGGLEGLGQLGDTFGKILNSVIAPITAMREDIRRTTFQEMTTFHRTGGRLPWETEAEAPAAETRSVVKLSQADMAALAQEVARRMKFSA